jgi:hypothetical protein
MKRVMKMEFAIQQLGSALVTMVTLVMTVHVSEHDYTFMSRN